MTDDRCRCGHLNSDHGTHRCFKCQCGSERAARIGREEAAERETARAKFRDDYTAELARARAKGYTQEHDHEHGPQHLLDWATEYIYRGEPIKAAALIAAARALLACDIHEHSAGNPEVGPRCGECRLGLGTHDIRDPLCEISGTGDAKT